MASASSLRFIIHPQEELHDIWAIQYLKGKSRSSSVLQVEAGNKQHWSKSKKWEIIASGWKLLTHNKLKWVQPGVSKCDAYAETATEVNK